MAGTAGDKSNEHFRIAMQVARQIGGQEAIGAAYS
jgi:hypothetical protein